MAKLLLILFAVNAHPVFDITVNNKTQFFFCEAVINYRELRIRNRIEIVLSPIWNGYKFNG